MDKLDPYQETGAAFLASRWRGSIFDEPGLGKTAQAIRALEIVGANKALVVCPAGVRQVWPHEIRKWSQNGLKALKASSVYDLADWQRGKANVLVCSFEQAVMWKDDFRKSFFDALIVDEAHLAKNRKARRTLALVGEEADGEGALAGMAARTWTMTGTPIKNDPTDLWVQLKLAGATDLNFTAFASRYFEPRAKTFSISYTPKKDYLPELHALIASMSVMRTFDDVGHQLPPIRMTTLPVDGNDRQIVEYLKGFPGLSERIVHMVNTEGKLAFKDSEHVSRLRSLIAEAKAPGYANFVTEELKRGEIDKLVVMANHRKAIRIVRDEIRKANMNAEEITGDTTERARERIVRSFQDEADGVRVIVGNIQAAGTGLTMTAACRLDMLESSWTPSDNVQAVRRVRRRGQTRPTWARFVMLNNSFDHTVAEVVVKKANTIISITRKDNLSEAMA